jgi:hypothetical protein
MVGESHTHPSGRRHLQGKGYTGAAEDPSHRQSTGWVARGDTTRSTAWLHGEGIVTHAGARWRPLPRCCSYSALRGLRDLLSAGSTACLKGDPGLAGGRGQGKLGLGTAGARSLRDAQEPHSRALATRISAFVAFDGSFQPGELPGGLHDPRGP